MRLEELENKGDPSLGDLTMEELLHGLGGVTDVLATMGVRSWRRKAQEREVWKGIVEEDKDQLGLAS